MLVVIAKREEALVAQLQEPGKGVDSPKNLFQAPLHSHICAAVVSLELGKVRLRASYQAAEYRVGRGRCRPKEAIDDGRLDAGDGLALHVLQHCEKPATLVGRVRVIGIELDQC